MGKDITIHVPTADALGRAPLPNSGEARVVMVPVNPDLIRHLIENHRAVIFTGFDEKTGTLTMVNA